jgi:flagellar hook assembly protein FlgD
VFNNSSEATIDFVVSSSASIKIEHLLNYPNPFTNQTAFYFEHNQANNNLEVMIQIFTISGILVKTIETQLTNNAFNSGPIAWDGTDDYGDKIGRGTYIYKVKVMNSLGETAEEFEKLVILK